MWMRILFVPRMFGMTKQVPRRFDAGCSPRKMFQL